MPSGPRLSSEPSCVRLEPAPLLPLATDDVYGRDGDEFGVSGPEGYPSGEPGVSGDFYV